MAFAALLGACGQLLLKTGSGKPLMQMIPWLIGFATVYGIAVLINLWAYRVGGKVTLLYPIISLSYIFTALLAWKILGEQLSAATIVGTIVVVIGVAIITLGAA